MAEKELLDEVIVSEQGALKTVASYFRGHLNLENFENWEGTHLEGFTGSETRIESRRLYATHFIEPAIQQPAEISSKTNATPIVEGQSALVG